jgi:putative Mg2+ transporter-C (MgtC) family protein
MVGLQSNVFTGLNDWDHIERTVIRLVVAAVLGGLIGIEREEHNKAAGLKTHILVSLGSALIMLVAMEAGIGIDHLSRVIQGLIVGIGFVGGGVILKREQQVEVIGITTAATIWVTAAIGMAVGMGVIVPAIVGVALAWLVLFVIRKIEPWIDRLLHHQ